MSKAKRLLLTIVIVLIAIFVVMQLAIPRLTAKTIEKELASLGWAESCQADVSAWPFWELLSGKADTLHIEAEEATLNQISVTLLSLDWQDLQWSKNSSWQTMPPNELKIAMDEEALMATLKTNSPFDPTEVRINGGSIDIVGQVELLGQTIQITTTGTLALADAGLNLKLNEITVHAGNFSGTLKDKLGKAINIPFDVSPLPWQVEPTKVEITTGKIEVWAKGGLK